MLANNHLDGDSAIICARYEEMLQPTDTAGLLYKNEQSKAETTEEIVDEMDQLLTDHENAASGQKVGHTQRNKSTREKVA